MDRNSCFVQKFFRVFPIGNECPDILHDAGYSNMVAAAGASDTVTVMLFQLPCTVVSVVWSVIVVLVVFVVWTAIAVALCVALHLNLLDDT